VLTRALSLDKKSGNRAARASRACRQRSRARARPRAIKRMQIKTFYLNDNITLVDASALA
jgi:hypothetical protein